MTLTTCGFTAWLKERVFTTAAIPASDARVMAGGGGALLPARGDAARPPRRIAAEVELLCLATDTRAVPSLRRTLLPWLRGYARASGWRELRAAGGAPRFRTAAGGVLTFEPGGQLEYAAPPFATPGALLADLRAVLGPLRDSAALQGIDLVARGIDPDNPLEHVPLQVRTARYSAMDLYFHARGEFGARMMRQTAAVQVSLDFGPDPALEWRILNAAAPALTALFASSRRYAGIDSGHASYRAHCWRRLDPARTGLLPCDSTDPVREYADFALAAPAMLLPATAAAGDHLPFGAWLRRGMVTERIADAHLSTLFPEVRPRRYLEVRSMDTVAIEMLAAPLLLVDGVLADRRARHEAAELLGRPEAYDLVVAGTHGLADGRLAGRVRDLVAVARAAWARHPGRYDVAARVEAGHALDDLLSPGVCCGAPARPRH